MGMGESLANLENVLRAIRIINAEWGLGIGARHITISTSELAPRIRKLGEERLQIRLAVFLHGATDKVRNRIMPINRRYNVETLLSACDYYGAHKKQHLTFEYILIADVNDSDDQARLLSRHAHRLSAKVNLIPYNSVSGLPWTRPSQKRQEKFLSIVRAERIPVTLRREKGTTSMPHADSCDCKRSAKRSQADSRIAPGGRAYQKTLRAETSSRLVFHHGRLRG
jgi:23S rRNA (adenine2503-C2)-methyltransferase